MKLKKGGTATVDVMDGFNRKKKQKKGKLQYVVIKS